MTTMRMFADACQIWDVVPWKQMRDSTPLSDTERINFKRHTKQNIVEQDVIVRYDERHIFLKNFDLAICIYDYERDFK